MFDVDFSDIDAVFRHLQDKYGSTNVARVGAFNRFTAKSATRKVCGVYGISQRDISKIVGWMPGRISFSLAEAISESSELRKWFKDNQTIYNCVLGLENTMSHFSTHAGGVIICDDLVSKLPITSDSEDRDKLVIALDKKQLEKLKHYKFDILGLNSLITLQDALEFTPEIDWSKVDYDDENVYNMLSTGNVLGVFQLSEQAHKVREQQPRNFEDLIAINSLIRPGVGDWEEYLRRRKLGQTDDLSYMNSTHGIIVYQEQYLLLAQTYAGWGIAFSDNNIRKNKDILNDTELANKFYEDSINNGYTYIKAKEIWDSICAVVAGGYGLRIRLI